jgi:hypothetical protein
MPEEKNLPMREKLDFQQVLFEMLMKYMREWHDLDMRSNNISGIEGTLNPYLDNKYREEKKKIFDEYAREMKKHGTDRYGKEISSNAADLKKDALDAIYKELMNLARRKGLLPEETIGGVSLRDRIGV